MKNQPAVLDPRPSDKPRTARRRAVKDLKRQLILEAAGRVFERDGLLGANIRAIAAEAGYTASAIYNHYAGKEAIYGDLLAQSLERLDTAVKGSADDTVLPAQRMRCHALAFYDFYFEHPRELDLGFYLFQGMRPLGLTPALNEDLNQRLRGVLSDIESSLRQCVHDPSIATRETTALFAHCVGLLLLTHTGRIRMFERNGRELLVGYLNDLLVRVQHEPTL